MALSYINNKEIKFGSSKPLNGVYTPGSPTREYEPLDSLGIYLNSGIPLSYGVENGRYMSMSDEFAAISQGNSYSFNQLFAAQMVLGFKLHDRFIACDTEHKIIGTEPLLHKAYLAEITEKTLDYFKIKIYEEKTRTFCIRMSSSEVPTSYVDLTNSFDENGLNLTQTDRQSFLSYYRFYPLTARDPSSRVEETLGVDYYLLPSAEGLKELSGDILSKFNAFISSDGALTSLGNTAFAYAGDIGYVPNYRGETSEAAVSAAKKAEVILGRVEEMHADINQLLPEMEENLELTKQYRDEAMSTEIGTVRTDLEAEINARIEADTALSTKIEVASSVNRYEIENLKAKAEGKLYRTETVEAEAYALDVPSSVAPYAEVQKIGGKSVVWNQLVNARFSSPQSNVGSQGTLLKTDSYTKVNSIASTTRLALGTTTKIPMVKGHKYYSHAILKVNGFNGNVEVGSDIAGVQAFMPRPVCPNNVWTTWDVLITRTNETSPGSGFSFYISGAYTDDTKELYVKEFSIIDLTQMFGSGNEPTLEECKKIFTADYYPYDAGTIKSFPVKRVKRLKADGTELGSIDVSSFTEGMKSAGSVHDEWQNGKINKRIKSINAKDYNWIYQNNFSYIILNDGKLSGACLANMPYKIEKYYMEANNHGFTIIYTVGAYASKDEFIADIQNVVINYELEIPIEESIPEIDNYIEVEGGGTLTFESDDTVHMPVPSTNRFVVDLTSTTEETT